MLLFAVLIIAILASIPFAYRKWMDLRTSVSTDNAYIEGDIVLISSKVTGTIVSLGVDDFQKVNEGDILAQLDQRDFQISVQQAQANYELALRNAETARVGVGQSATQAEAQNTQAQGGLSLTTTSIEVAQAAVDAAQAAVASSESRLEQVISQRDQAQQDLERYQTLSDEGIIAQQQLDHARSTYDVAQAAVESAQNDITLAESRLRQAELNVNVAEAQQTQSEGGVQSAEASAEQTDIKQAQYEAALAQVDVAQVALDAAQLQLSYTTITAPVSGRLGLMAAEAGQRVTAGQPLMPIVEDVVYVIANFKETQMDKIRPGLGVEIKVDAFPGRIFQAHVDSISPASGSIFALLPPENASGNFTKVVQRIPVKIVFDEGSLEGYQDLLEPGMSVIVKVIISPQ
jgi:membrane fusion protein, multidrug efflux system